MEHLLIDQKELKNYKLGNLPPYQYIANPVANHQQDWTITRVSVIIPAFNAFDTIPQTLMSIAMQENIHEIETIIVDDCSTEGTYDEIASIFSQFMKIKVIRLEKGLGPGGARQVGFDHATGYCLTAIDADDCFCRPDAIAQMERVMFEKDQDCVVGQFLEQNEQGWLHVHNLEMV
jgi:succinoglycan biosynthesis protein ExoO